MINILNKQDCCGCTACAEKCPRKCITMIADEEGFLYPHVDERVCLHCDLCEKVCPILNNNPIIKPFKVFAAYHKDTAIRNASSSGGVFTAFAESVIRHGGVVFGARFDEKWRVVHSYTESIEGLVAFRGSKYVQSNVGNSYKEVEQFLKCDRLVLFSGTPCQVAGLKHFLCKDYPNLLTIDFICHGVPSPLVWSKYVDTLRPKGVAGENLVSSLKKMPVITGLFFRDKRAGWRKFGFSAWIGVTEGSDGNTFFPPKHQKRIKYEILQQNTFLRGFLQNLYLRPSCHHCPFRNFKSGSDMTIADYWGVRHLFPDMDDDKGLSLAIQKAEIIPLDLGESLNTTIIRPDDYEKAFEGNDALENDAKPSKNRLKFWDEFQKSDLTIVEVIRRNTNYSRKSSIRNNFDLLLLSIGLYNSIKKTVRLIRNKSYI